MEIQRGVLLFPHVGLRNGKMRWKGIRGRGNSINKDVLVATRVPQSQNPSFPGPADFSLSPDVCALSAF